MSENASHEAERVRAAYARRAELGLDARYDYWTPANLFIYQSRERAFLAALRRAALLPMESRRVLDVGCGDGSVLRDLLRYGAKAEHLSGIDLLADRVERARGLTPGASITLGDAQALNYGDASFDLVLGFTLLSSVKDEAARRQMASEMLRVAKPGGRIILYDFWINPLNPDVRPLRRDHVKRLFAGHEIAFRGVTLAPPLVRLLVNAPLGWLACMWLEMIPFVRTHYLAVVTV